MNRNKTLLVLVVVVIALAGLVGGIAAMRSTEESLSADTSRYVTGEKITIDGTMTCLTLKEVSSTATTSCALGIKTQDGKSYALSSDDTSVTSSLKSGQQVRAEGKLANRVTQYDISGTLEVEKLTVL
jgi:hypothetical protein